MPSRCQRTTVISPGATTHHSCGSVGINFAVKYCCYKNLDDSYSIKYTSLPVSQVLMLEDHQDVGLGCDAAARWLADQGQKVLYARKHWPTLYYGCAFCLSSQNDMQYHFERNLSHVWQRVC